MPTNNSKQRRQLRQAEARARQDFRDDKTDDQQIHRLDILLGKGVGATRERARLTAHLPEKKEKKTKKKDTSMIHQQMNSTTK